MKNKLIILFAFSFLLFSSCTDEGLLEKADTGDLTKEKVYSNITLADEVLNGLYNRVRNVHRDGINDYGAFSAGAYLDMATVYGQPHMNWSSAIAFINGSWDANNCWFNNGINIVDGRIWPVNYASIRNAWQFIENIDNVPFDQEYGYGETEKNQKKGEAYFLLAWYYHELVSFYGGVPLVKGSLTTTDEELKKPRNTYDECVDYILELCDEAYKYLPNDWPANQLGRITKGACVALKSRVLLYAASPLFNNPNRPEDSPFRGKYDTNKWRLAAEAAADVIRLNKYELWNDISTLFIQPTHKEVIFQRMNEISKAMEAQDNPPKVGNGGGNVGRNQVTYNMFKLYKHLDGGVAYDQDKSPSFDLQDPFKNLDPRFYRDIIYNGSNTKRVKNVQLWAPGEDGSKGASNTTNNCSFLIVRKFTDTDVDKTKPAAVHHNMIYIRYAEILLNYAEAMNEAFGPEVDGLGIGLTALDAVNKIRQRTKYPTGTYAIYYENLTGGMPDVPSGLSKEEFRKEIRQERKVELCFERHLFFDLRRWKESPESQRNCQWLVPSRNNDKSFTYTIVDKPRAFESSWYLMPIDEKQVIINEYDQNPGWFRSSETDND